METSGITMMENVLFADSEQAWCDSTSNLESKWTESRGQPQKPPQIWKNNCQALTVVSPQFALCDCPGKGFHPPLDRGDNVGLTLECWEIFPELEQGPGLSEAVSGVQQICSCPLGIHIPTWGKAVRDGGRRMQSWWWPLLSFCLGIPWERRHRWEKSPESPGSTDWGF